MLWKSKGARLWHTTQQFFSLTGVGKRIEPQGVTGLLVGLLALVGTTVIIYMALFGVYSEMMHVGLFIMFLYPIGFLTTSISKAVMRLTWFDYLLAVASFGLAIWYVLNEPRFHVWMVNFDRLSTFEIFAGLALVGVTLELVRRSTGWPLLTLCIVFLFYGGLGDLIPNTYGHAGIDVHYFLEMQLITMAGLFGEALYVVATYAFLFVLFGAFFHMAGGGQLFYDIAVAATGRLQGGPSKACVAASALYGSISGSPTADVATTGPITIPVMRRCGISAKRAAAIEAAASSGGALLPPVMGAVVFLMADFTGIPYRDILIAALLSGLLYYLGVFMMVHFEARRFAIGRLPEAEIVGMRAAIKRGWLNLIPVVALTYALLSGYSPAYVAAGASLLALVTSWVTVRHAIGPRRLMEGALETCSRAAPLVAAVAAAGLIVGTLNMTGLAGKFADLLYALAGGQLIPSLIATAIVLIILGMGMPTVSVYLLGAGLIAPMLTGKFGLPLLPVHLFIVYFASLSAVTPPIAVACFTSAAIAGADALSVAARAAMLAFAGYILPFFFLFNPALIMQGDFISITWAFIVATVMIISLAVAVSGWVFTEAIPAWARLAFAVLAIGLIYPDWTTQIPIAALVISSYGWLYLKSIHRRNQTA